MFVCLQSHTRTTLKEQSHGQSRPADCLAPASRRQPTQGPSGGQAKPAKIIFGTRRPMSRPSGARPATPRDSSTPCVAERSTPRSIFLEKPKGSRGCAAPLARERQAIRPAPRAAPAGDGADNRSPSPVRNAGHFMVTNADTRFAKVKSFCCYIDIISATHGPYVSSSLGRGGRPIWLGNCNAPWMNTVKSLSDFAVA